MDDILDAVQTSQTTPTEPPPSADVPPVTMNPDVSVPTVPSGAVASEPSLIVPPSDAQTTPVTPSVSSDTSLSESDAPPPEPVPDMPGSEEPPKKSNMGGKRNIKVLLAGLVLLIVSLPLIVLGIRQQVEIRSRATASCVGTSLPNCKVNGLLIGGCAGRSEANCNAVSTCGCSWNGGTTSGGGGATSCTTSEKLSCGQAGCSIVNGKATCGSGGGGGGGTTAPYCSSEKNRDCAFGCSPTSSGGTCKSNPGTGGTGGGSTNTCTGTCKSGCNSDENPDSSMKCPSVSSGMNQFCCVQKSTSTGGGGGTGGGSTTKPSCPGYCISGVTIGGCATGGGSSAGTDKYKCNALTPICCVNTASNTCTGTRPNCTTGEPTCKSGAWTCPVSQCSGAKPSTCPTTANCTNTPTGYKWTCPVAGDQGSASCPGLRPNCVSGEPTCQNGGWVCPASGGACAAGAPYYCSCDKKCHTQSELNPYVNGCTGLCAAGAGGGQTPADAPAGAAPGSGTTSDTGSQASCESYGGSYCEKRCHFLAGPDCGLAEGPASCDTKAGACEQIDCFSPSGSYVQVMSIGDCSEGEKPPCTGDSCGGGGKSQCVDIKIYKDGKALTNKQIKALQPGDKVTLALKGAGKTTKARFKVNSTDWEETTTKNADKEYTLDWTVPANTKKFVIEGERFNGKKWE